LDARRFAQPEAVVAVLDNLASSVLNHLPLPGSGQTADRFAALSATGQINLNLGRLAEAHADAVAILAELAPGYLLPESSIWGVWAAEHPAAQLWAHRGSNPGEWIVEGDKAWCSGAGICTHALVTARADDGPRLLAVDLRPAGASPVGDAWPTPALAGTDTRMMTFVDCPAISIGEVEEYLSRPGFWHGAVGVAAVWYGGAVAIARRLLETGRKRDLAEVDLAHLGAVDAALVAARSTLESAARAFDADPYDQTNTGAVVARSARAVVEAAASDVIDRVGRSLGPSPLTGDDEHWRRVGDLQLYLRQSHAERDLVDLGRRLIATVPQW
jgi:alkylation response protein AidB-like acyl-CoA dehydrogenase